MDDALEVVERRVLLDLGDDEQLLRDLRAQLGDVGRAADEAEREILEPMLDRDEGPPKVLSDRTVGGFVYPESVGCDATERVLYVSNFGGKELKPAEKDGLGYVSKVPLAG